MLADASAPPRDVEFRRARMRLDTRIATVLGKVGLRPRLLFLLFLAIVPLTALVGYVLWSEQQQTLQRARDGVSEAARLAASSQSSVFDEARSTLKVLQALPQVRVPVSFAACSAIAANLHAANPNFNTVGAVDAEGMITCHSKLTQSQRFGGLDLLEQARTALASDFLVGRFTIERASGKPTLITLMPLVATDGSFAGAVFVSLSLEHMSAAAEALSNGGSRVVTMVESDTGRMLTRYPPLPVPFGTAFPDHPLARAMRAMPNGGVVEAKSLDGVERIFGFSPMRGIEKTGIMLSIGEPRDPLLSPVRTHLVVSVSILAAIFVLAFASTWWLGYWTHLRPINRLRKTAELVGDGDHAARATLEPWQAPEFQLFGKRLDEMATKLAAGREAELAVAESHRYLMIAERLAQVGYWQYDPRTDRSTWSDEVFRIYGLPIGSQPPSFEDCVAACHADERQLVGSSFSAAVTAGTEFEIQVRVIRSTGEVRHTLNRACVEVDEAGKVSLVYGALLDITDLKQAELKTQAANAMLLMAEEVSEVGHWRLDLRSGSLVWSEQIYRIHGRDPGTYVPLLDSAIDAYHPHDRESVSMSVSSAVESNGSFEFQKRIVRPDGEVREVISRGRCEVDPMSGSVVAIFGVIMDVTAAKVAERELRAKSTLLETTLDTMDQGLIMVGTDGRLDIGNRRFAELLDLPDELLREDRPDFDDILAFLDARGEYADVDPDFRQHVRTRGAPFTLGTYERRRPNGRVLEVRTIGLPNNDGIVRTYTDISDRRAAERGMRESELRYRMLVENASDMIFRLDRELVRTYVSPASTEIIGYAPEELVGRTAATMSHPDEVALVAQTYADVLDGLERTDVTSRIRHRDGRWIWVEVELRALRDPVTNAVTGILGALRDVSDRKRAEELVAESEARFRLLAENTADLVTHVDATGKRIFASPAARDLLGYEPEELVGGRPIDLAYPDDRAVLGAMLTALAEGQASEPVQYRARRKDGIYRWIEATGRPLGPERGYILALRDIERRKQAEDELGAAVLRLNELANSDGLTGLANRRCFDESLEREISRAARSGAPISLLLADVDHFKAYNDTYGHPAGDACLRSVADILAQTTRRPGDVAARYGGEEFAAILPETDAAGALALAQSFRTAVAAASLEHVRSGFGVVTISVGIVTLVPDPRMTRPLDVIGSADSALYRAKGSGRNCVIQFEREETTLPKAS